MMVTSENYDQMRAWMAHMTPEVFPGWEPDSNPVRVLDTIFAESPGNARKGLAMAIGDIIEATEYWSSDQVAAIDRSLKRECVPTLTEMRLRFSKVVKRVVGRGKINNEVEYYAIRNAAELDQHNQALWNLLTAYESQSAD